MLEEELQLEIAGKTEEMEQVITSFHYELNKVRTGRANPLLLSSVFVDYYGALTPINQIASISVVEGRQLVIQPYDRSIIKQIVAAITKANLQGSLQEQGDYIRMIIPTLTEETRKKYVKQVKEITEDMRVRIRNLRRDFNELVKKAKISKDSIQNYQEDIQTLTNKYINQIDKISEAKEKEVMTV